MVEDKENNTSVIMWSGLFLIIGILICAGYFLFFPLAQEPIPIPEPTPIPLLDSSFDAWGENSENPQESIFAYWITNYGDVEAKNVGVTCKVWNGNTVINEFNDNIGNVASNSWTYKETYRDKVPQIPGVVGICYVSSCEGDCDILWEHVEDYREIYGE